MIRSSDSLAKLAPALTAAQAEMTNAPKETRGQVGSQVRYYTDLPTITDLVRPILARHDLAFVQFPSGGGDGTVTVGTRLLHSSGEWMEDELSMPCGSNGAQGVGSAITYAKRYSLMAVLGVAADDDDGAAASQPVARQRATGKAQGKPVKTITAAQRKYLFAAAKAHGLGEAAIREVVARHLGGDASTADMPVAVFDAIIRDIEAGLGAPAGGRAEPPAAAPPAPDEAAADEAWAEAGRRDPDDPPPPPPLPGQTTLGGGS